MSEPVGWILVDTATPSDPPRHKTREEAEAALQDWEAYAAKRNLPHSPGHTAECCHCGDGQADCLLLVEKAEAWEQAARVDQHEHGRTKDGAQ